MAYSRREYFSVSITNATPGVLARSVTLTLSLLRIRLVSSTPPSGNPSRKKVTRPSRTGSKNNLTTQA